MLRRMPALDSVIAESLRLCIGSITVRRAMVSFALKIGEVRRHGLCNRTCNRTCNHLQSL